MGKPLAQRPRHQDKDIEAFMKECERRRWTFTKGSKYFLGKCGCGVHTKTVHLTPNGAYLRNLKNRIQKMSCW